jgi:hypothetical protein
VVVSFTVIELNSGLVAAAFSNSAMTSSLVCSAAAAEALGADGSVGAFWPHPTNPPVASAAASTSAKYAGERFMFPSHTSNNPYYLY